MMIAFTGSCHSLRYGGTEAHYFLVDGHRRRSHPLQELFLHTEFLPIALAGPLSNIDRDNRFTGAKIKKKTRH
jgi:hypothetical protein